MIEPERQGIGRLADATFDQIIPCPVSDHRCPRFAQARPPAIAALCGWDRSREDAVPAVAYKGKAPVRFKYRV
jgi:hypothetical protein